MTGAVISAVEIIDGRCALGTDAPFSLSLSQKLCRTLSLLNDALRYA